MLTRKSYVPTPSGGRKRELRKSTNQKRYQQLASRLPPGGRSWPLIGDGLKWYSAVASSHPPSFVEEQVKRILLCGVDGNCSAKLLSIDFFGRYGRIFSCSIFGKQTVVSADPTFNRFIMQNEGRLFQSCYPKSFRDLVGKDGVINVQGEQQRKLHAIASNMMRLDKLNSGFLKDIQMVMLQTLDNFQDNEVILLQDVAINLMVNQLLGVSSESEVNEIANLFSDFVDGCLSVPINLPGFTFFTAMKARGTIIRKINKTIDKRRQQHAQNSGDGFLGRLLEEENLPEEAVADFIINLLFAGNETTAKTMLFAIYFLTHCPLALKELLEEQERLRSKSSGSDFMLTWEDYKSLPFTQCVIDETLRIGGIAIWLLREAKVDVSYRNYVIPKGCVVVPFLSAVHLDESLYTGPTNFNPWRWMDPENKEKRNWRSSPFFSPFGGGARFCPGAELARLQIAFFLHLFVTRYRWEQVKEDRMSFFPSARLVNGFQIRLNRHPSAVSTP
ncbi:hypothetical protein ACLOJK_014288 [Asimina triloba]